MSRNFSLGSRDLGRAGCNALKLQAEAKSMSYKTAHTYSLSWQKFSSFCRESGINRIEKITHDTVRSFVENLKNQEISSREIANRISVINNVMRFATGGAWTLVQGRKDCDLERRTQVRTAPTPSRESFEKAMASLSDPRAKAILSLCRNFGLREREASTLNAKTALRQALSSGSIKISCGTKGGRDREVPITDRDRQLSALREAAAIQGRNKSVIPHEKTYIQFANSTLKVAREALRAAGGGRIHDLRAAYAAERYEILTGGTKAPCNSESGSRECAKEVDAEARMTISQELGHSRIDVTASYLGSKK